MQQTIDNMLLIKSYNLIFLKQNVVFGKTTKDDNCDSR